jgi:hypothetical protein
MTALDETFNTTYMLMHVIRLETQNQNRKER